jgi:hemoglobin-like flavoprotein
MTPEYIRIVQSSWAQVQPIKETAGQFFCERLLQADPTLTCLSRVDKREQGVTYLRVIDVAVSGLDRQERTAHLMRKLGVRHADCAARELRYYSISIALLSMLHDCLGADFTPTVRHAWETVFGELAAIMRASAVAALRRLSFPLREAWLEGAA